MKVPPASTYLSRTANEVASSVRLPISIAPRLSVDAKVRVRQEPAVVAVRTHAPAARAGPEGLHSQPVLHNALGTLTSRLVAGSVPIVRYLMTRVSEMESTLSQTEEPGHRAPDPGRVEPMSNRVIGRRSVLPKLTTRHAQAQQPVRPRGQRRGHGMSGRPRQVRLDQHHGTRRGFQLTQPSGVERPHRGRV